MSRAKYLIIGDFLLLQVEADIVIAVAEHDRVDLLAKWMGVLIRGGHAGSVRLPLLRRPML